MSGSLASVGWLDLVARCVECGGMGLERAEDRAHIQCPECRAVFAVRDGIPVMLPQSLLSDDVPDSEEEVERLAEDDVGLAEHVARANRYFYDSRPLGEYARVHHGSESHQSQLDHTGMFAELKRGRPEATTLVDAGAGDCRVTSMATEHFPEVVALDISQRMLVESRKATDNIIRICASADNTPLADESVDVVIAMALLHHLADVRAFFREVCRVLKPGGVLHTAHDPNGGLLRIYRAMRRATGQRDMRYRWLGGVGEALAEYNITFGDLRLRTLRDQLASTGFENVRVRGYVTRAKCESRLEGLARPVLAAIHRIHPDRLSTHLTLTASRPPQAHMRGRLA